MEGVQYLKSSFKNTLAPMRKSGPTCNFKLASREIWPCMRPQAKNCLVWSKKDKVLALPNHHCKTLLQTAFGGGKKKVEQDKKGF